MKSLITMLLIMAATLNVCAQGQPLYIVDTNKPNIDKIVLVDQPFDWGVNLTQSIYHKSDFPTMPMQGFITDVFLQIGYTTPVGSTLQGLTVKMGTTSMNYYPIGNFSDAQFLAMDSALTTVFYDSFYVLPATIPSNSWWRLTLPQHYQYSMLPLPGDVPQNLVVQLSKSEYTFNLTWKFHISEIQYQAPFKMRCATARKNDIPGQIVGWGAGNFVQLIGFNGYALSVDDPQKKIPFSVFPNPATDKLHVSKEASGVYEVYDLRGVKVKSGLMKEGEEVNVQSLSPGMYLLRMGGQTVRFVKE